MRVDKVILRAALSTLAAIVGLIAFMIVTLSFLSPWTMMNITYDLGMDGSCIRNAKRAYNMTDDVYYAAFATDVAIGKGDDEKVVECGALFIADDDFGAYCAEKTAQWTDIAGTYDQYVYAQVSLARYRLGDKDGALATAFSGLDGGFAENNAVVAVLVTALAAGDTDTVGAIEVKMNEMQTQISEEQAEYFGKMLELARNG